MTGNSSVCSWAVTCCIEGIVESQEIMQYKNPLEEDSPGKLILRYSFPAIVSSLINSVYNIVDQIFVGNSEGRLGNAGKRHKTYRSESSPVS